MNNPMITYFRQFVPSNRIVHLLTLNGYFHGYLISNIKYFMGYCFNGRLVVIRLKRITANETKPCE